MERDDKDNRIAELFARLTLLLEDAAALAAEGQRAGMSPEERRALATGIGALVHNAQEGLSEALRQLGS